MSDQDSFIYTGPAWGEPDTLEQGVPAAIRKLRFPVDLEFHQLIAWMHQRIRKAYRASRVCQAKRRARPMRRLRRRATGSTPEQRAMRARHMRTYRAKLKAMLAAGRRRLFRYDHDQAKRLADLRRAERKARAAASADRRKGIE